MVTIALAAPAWRNFDSRRHIAEALKDADAMKVVVLEAATVHGGLAEVRSTDLHYNPDASVSTYVAHAEIADGGLITLHTRDTGISPDPVLMLIPREKNDKEGAEITWTCRLILSTTPLSTPNCLNQTPTQARPAIAPGVQTLHSGSDAARALAHAGMAL
jgi:type IV pilus assembly protein PilA